MLEHLGTPCYRTKEQGRLARVLHFSRGSKGGKSRYTYDALDRVVEKNSATQTVYGPTGKLALMSGGTLSKAFVPLPAGDEAVYTSTGLAYYRHKDWRGSSPLATTPSRTMYSDVNYAPYGESYPTGAADLNFTGDNQDMLAGLYDTENRELHPNQGRWISPDPAGLGAADPTNPQSWNRYAYVMNSPLGLVDPSGLDWCVYDNGDGQTATVIIDEGGGAVDCLGDGFYIETTATSVTSVTLDANDDLAGWNGTTADGTIVSGVVSPDAGADPADATTFFFGDSAVFFSGSADSGPLNKNFQQPPEKDPVRDILDEIEEKASKVADTTEALINAIKVLSNGGTMGSAPLVMANPCGSGSNFNMYSGTCSAPNP